MTRLRQFLERLGSNFRIYSKEQLHDLLSTRFHPFYIVSHRSLLNIERVRIFSLLFALLIPPWLLLDYLVLSSASFKSIFYVKVGATALFALLAWPVRKSASLSAKRFMLAVFLFIFPMIFLASGHALSSARPDDGKLLPIQLYALLPYLSIAGLGLFPLTVLEAVSYAVSLAAIAVGGWLYFLTPPLTQILPSVILLVIVASLALLSSAIQLQDMISLVSRPTYDPLTGALSRRSGMDSIARDFEMAQMHDEHFAISLVEMDGLDNFDDAHNTSLRDQTILDVADILREDLRSSDRLIRWDDRTFLIVFPYTDCTGAKVIIERIRKLGLGTLPDGQPLKASIGVAERVRDDISDWHALIDRVGRRANQARQNGIDQNRYCGEEIDMK